MISNNKNFLGRVSDRSKATCYVTYVVNLRTTSVLKMVEMYVKNAWRTMIHGAMTKMISRGTYRYMRTSKQLRFFVRDEQVKLNLKFSVDGRVLSAKVIHIDNNLRDAGVLGTHGGLAISSVCNPAFGQYDRIMLFVAGRDAGRDKEVATRTYSSAEAAKMARKTYQTIVRQINGSQT